jgi:nucleotide-binding universal stress UspA family protein
MKVVLAIDGSRSSLNATRALVSLLGAREDIAVHVVNVQAPMRYFDLLSSEKQKIVQQWQEAAGDHITQAARRLLAMHHVKHELHVLLGDPAEAIVRFANRLGCELVIMGTRGMGSISGLVLGSVATKVVHLCEIPVLLEK